MKTLKHNSELKGVEKTHFQALGANTAKLKRQLPVIELWAPQ